MIQVFILGLVSFFVDISTEMVYPLLPIFITGILGASVAVLGVIEGLAESTASILKVFSGYISDRVQKRKFLALFGYGFSWVGKIFFAIATSWQYVFTGRILDRIGKGIRTAPRDALIADYSDKSKRGYAYGIHRSFDTLGAFTGVGIVLLIVSKTSFDFHNVQIYRNIFLLSIIPAITGWLILFAIKDKPDVSSNRQKISLSFKNLPRKLKMFLVFTFVFALGNSSNQFLLLKIQKDTGSLFTTLEAYLIFNLVYAALSIPCGRISDLIGQKTVLLPVISYMALFTGFSLGAMEFLFIFLLLACMDFTWL